jgi:hypothetical protein
MMKSMLLRVDDQKSSFQPTSMNEVNILMISTTITAAKAYNTIKNVSNIAKSFNYVKEMASKAKEKTLATGRRIVKLSANVITPTRLQKNYLN